MLSPEAWLDREPETIVSQVSVVRIPALSGTWNDQVKFDKNIPRFGEALDVEAK